MKKYNIFLWFIAGCIPIINACREDLRDIDPEPEPFSSGLDLNFSFVNKPGPGTELIAGLYYAEEENEPFYERDPEEVLRHNLTAQDIEDGLTLTFEAPIPSPLAYASLLPIRMQTASSARAILRSVTSHSLSGRS